MTVPAGEMPTYSIESDFKDPIFRLLAILVGHI